MTTTDQTYSGQTYSPYITDGELFGETVPLRRLFIVNYSCPLCGDEHDAETYVAHTTRSVDELHAHARACLRQADVALPLLGQHMFLLHNDRGDYHQLREEADAGNPKGPLRLISVSITGESELSCDDCARRFDTIGALNEHIGLNPYTLARTGPPECMAGY